MEIVIVDKLHNVHSDPSLTSSLLKDFQLAVLKWVSWTTIEELFNVLLYLSRQ